MSKRLIIIYLALLSTVLEAVAAVPVSLRGRIVDSDSGQPVAGARIRLGNTLETLSLADGTFSFTTIEPAIYAFSVHHDGFREYSLNIKCFKDMEGFTVSLVPLALSADAVDFYPDKTADGSYHLSREALSLWMISDIADAFSTIPGGFSARPDLSKSLPRGVSVKWGDLQIGGNALDWSSSGLNTGILPTSFIGGISIRKGVASAEEGNMTGPLISITPLKGSSPWIIQLGQGSDISSTSVYKGFSVGRKGASISFGGEWTKWQSYNTDASVRRRSLSLMMESPIDERNSISANILTDAQHYLSPQLALNLRKGRSSVKLYGGAFWRNWTKLAPQTADNLILESGYYISALTPSSDIARAYDNCSSLDAQAGAGYMLASRVGKAENLFSAGVQYKSRGVTLQNTLRSGAVYLNDKIIAAGGKLSIEAGLRAETVLSGAEFLSDRNSLHPRLNIRWNPSQSVTLFGGAGTFSVLPSYGFLNIGKGNTNIETFSFQFDGQDRTVYYSHIWGAREQSEIKMQRGLRTELGTDISLSSVNISLSGHYNTTSNPYRLIAENSVLELNFPSIPSDYALPTAPFVTLDHQSGDLWFRASDQEYWTGTDAHIKKVEVPDIQAYNGKDINNFGADARLEFPEITSIWTKVSIDGGYDFYSGLNLSGLDSDSTIARGRISSLTHIPHLGLLVNCAVEAYWLSGAEKTSGYLVNFRAGKDISKRLNITFSAHNILDLNFKPEMFYNIGCTVKI